MILEFQQRSISRFSQPVKNHAFLLRCKPYENIIQRLVSFNAEISGCNMIFAQKDSFGNNIIFSNINDYHDNFTLKTSGVVEVFDNKKDTSLNPIFRYPSPLCILDNEMSLFALGFKDSDIKKTVKNLCDAVNRKMKYQSGTTCISTTSLDAFKLGSGVCQDYSHVLIALLRSLQIPARYVAGYVKGLTMSHAWTEAFYDGFWHGFDATENSSQLDGYIKIAIGRDASDCPLNRGIFVGNVTETVEIEINVNEL